MELKEVLNKVDHILLDPESTNEDYARLCREGILYSVASICVPPSKVNFCKKLLEDKLPICTVVGFPNGYHDSETKAYEAETAIKNGATEIDMIIDIGKIKEHRYKEVVDDINRVRKSTKDYILNIIIETSTFDDAEKVVICDIVNKSGADAIKASATNKTILHDISLLKKHSSDFIKVKTTGEIASIGDAVKLVKLGVDRLGTGKIIKMVQRLETQNI